MKTQHITDENIIAWIQESLSSGKSREIANHIEDCDKCYLRYSTLLESNLNSKAAKPENVPDEILQYAKEQLGIDNNVQPDKPIESKLKIFGKRFKILRPIPVMAFAATVAMLLILFNLPETVKEQSPFMLTSKVSEPITVRIMNDSLIISQSSKVENMVSIISPIGDTLFTDKFDNLEMKIPLANYNAAKIQIVISVQNISVLDTTLEL